MLYTLYDWQYESPKAKSTALAAALSYWGKQLFILFGIKFDFINTRYQPLYRHMNYYQKVPLAHEKQLAKDIIEEKSLMI